jgi:hypothetical protein
VLRINGDPQTAADFVERALYTFEAAFHVLFSVTTGQCRLDYNVFENRAFFLALHRHIEGVALRGATQTAFELCKLLYSLSPDEDPLVGRVFACRCLSGFSHVICVCVWAGLQGALLMVDFYALQAGAYPWLQDFCARLEPTKALSWLPNFAYSLAFAAHAAQKPDAEALLHLAILRFPHVVGGWWLGFFADFFELIITRRLRC